jgi:Biotin carboxylase, N-terminal domain
MSALELSTTDAHRAWPRQLRMPCNHSFILYTGLTWCDSVFLRRDIRLAGVPKRISSLSQQVDTFVKSCGGTAPIYSILVANNGIAAVKFIRSIRKWAFTTFGSDKAISLVAMATHEDIKSNAEHIHMADQFVEVPGGGSTENYGNVKLIGQIASQAAVDAVWPGWYCPFLQ